MTSPPGEVDPEHAADLIGADAQTLWDPGWPERHGASFDWTPADDRAFMRAHGAHLRRRSEKARGRSGRAFDAALGLALLTFVVASAVAGVSLARGYYADPGSNVVAGALLGAGAMLIGCILFAVRAARASRVERTYIITAVRVGVEGGALWFYRHRTLVVFRDRGAFVEIVRSGDVLLAFVNRMTAYGFPRGTLTTTPEGREVLGWFDARWPVGDDAGSAPETSRQALRRELRRIWRIGWKIAVLMAAFALAMSLYEAATDRQQRIPERDWILPGRTGDGAGGRSSLPALSGRDPADDVGRPPRP